MDMQHAMQAWLSNLRDSGQASVTLARCWVRQEWQYLQGHQVDMQERLRLARQADSLSALMSAQLDLLPESRRRLQRNAASRRAMLAELGDKLRRALPGPRTA